MKEEEAFFPALVKEHFSKKEEDAIVEVSQSEDACLARWPLGAFLCLSIMDGLM